MNYFKQFCQLVKRYKFLYFSPLWDSKLVLLYWKICEKSVSQNHRILHRFVKNISSNSTKLCFIQDFTISMFALKKICMVSILFCSVLVRTLEARNSHCKMTSKLVVSSLFTSDNIYVFDKRYLWIILVYVKRTFIVQSFQSVGFFTLWNYFQKTRLFYGIIHRL